LRLFDAQSHPRDCMPGATRVARRDSRQIEGFCRGLGGPGAFTVAASLSHVRRPTIV
jgi:hypothetical protein